MQRRRFLALSSAGVLGGLTSIRQARAEVGDRAYRSFRGLLTSGAPKPLPSITLAVDTVLPKDPLVPDDFAASDYGADALLAEKLGYLGQALLAGHLNFHALRTSRKLFVSCDESERLDAIRAWIMDRDKVGRVSKDLLSGLLSLTVVGTFEGKPKEVRDVLYEKMGWYDPARPTETFHVPCQGYSNLAR